jgi:heat shock protein HslJ
MLRALLLVSLLAALLACQGSSTARAPAPVPAPGPDALANATYSGVYLTPITLVGGLWEGEPFELAGASRPRVELAPDFRLLGDLDSRPGEEAVVVLSESSGGSGSFDYIAVMGRAATGSELVNLGTASIGDRVGIRSARIVGRQLVLELVQAGPEDAACCPSQLATRAFTLANEGLQEVSHDVTGTLSLAELEAVEWVLTHLGRKQRAPATPELTLRFDGERIAGSSGCNRFFGGIESGRLPGDLRIGPLGGTRMACPEPQMLLEQRFLSALQSVVKFGFVTGRLYLLSDEAGVTTVLLFEPRSAAPPAKSPGS